MNNLIDKNLLNAEIINIYWERINLYIDVKVTQDEVSDVPLIFYALNEKCSAKAKFDTEKIEETVYRLSLNITNIGNRQCIPDGNYSISVCQGDNELALCNVSPEIVGKMSDFSRAFPFSNRTKVFDVVFYVSDDVEYSLPLHMVVITAEQEKKHKSYSKRLKRFFKKDFKRLIIILFYKLFSYLYHNKKDVILIMSEQNKKISSNQKAVYDRLLERGLNDRYKLMFSYRAAVSEKQSLTSWMKLTLKLAQADVIILDDHAPVFDWLVVNKNVKIIQLWHAGAGFKSSGYSRWGNLGCPSPFSCHRQYKYGIAGSKKIAHFFSEVWGIDTEYVLPTGMPRIDEYLNEDYRKTAVKAVYDKYPLCKEKKVILFAPTYRGKNRFDAHYPFELIDFDKLYETCGDEYVVLFKMHPWVAQPVPIKEEYKDRFADACDYPNINDLFYITDLLITDYSSSIFEYSLMKKPMLFFAFDEIQYSFSRGFHRDYKKSAPGKIVYKFDELISAINNQDFEFEKVEEYVNHHFDYIDTHSSDRVIDWLILENIPQDLQKAIDDKNSEVRKTAELTFYR